jgi:transcriptional regulator with XRE-family HTH domain
MAEAVWLLARQRVAVNARRLRDQLGWTQEIASEKIECSVQALRRVEGAKAVVTLDLLSEIASAYRTDLSQLFVASGPWRQPQPGRPVTRSQPAGAGVMSGAASLRPAARAAEGRAPGLGTTAKKSRRAKSKTRR